MKEYGISAEAKPPRKFEEHWKKITSPRHPFLLKHDNANRIPLHVDGNGVFAQDSKGSAVKLMVGATYKHHHPRGTKEIKIVSLENAGAAVPEFDKFVIIEQNGKKWNFDITAFNGQLELVSGPPA